MRMHMDGIVKLNDKVVELNDELMKRKQLQGEVEAEVVELKRELGHLRRQSVGEAVELEKLTERRSRLLQSGLAPIRCKK